MNIFWPVLIFVVCFGGGAAACTRWLPDLEPGGIGGLAFFCVCGLAGAALAVAGVHLYSIIYEVGREREVDAFGGAFLADGLAEILMNSGTLVALALIVYLMALRRRPAPAAVGDPEQSLTARD